ncbi:MAG: choice-of-anchor B family protein [Planctomycetota bacterium]|nr:choice-of-anchor B family protein [Planctomycetota bacterium]
MTRSLACAPHLTACVAAFAALLLSAAAPAPARHDDDPKILDRRPPYAGPGYLRGAAAAGLRTSNAGAASGFAAQGLRLESWLTLGDLDGAGSGNDCWGYASPSGREYAVVGTSTSTIIVEVTDPANAAVIETIPGPGSLWRDVKTYQDRAYSVSEGGGGIQVIDLSAVDAGVVSLENTVTGSGDERTHNVAIDEASGYLYRTGGGGNGLRIYSLANPSSPQYVGSWGSRYVHDAQVVTYTSGPYAGRQLAFCCAGLGNGSGDTGLSIVDVTNKNFPFRIEQIAYPNRRYSHQGWLSPDRTRFYLGDELDENAGVNTTVTRVFDVSDPGNASFIGEFSNGVSSISHNMYERDGLLFQANYTSGLRVFDTLSDPNSPAEIASFDTAPDITASSFNGLWSCYVGLPSGTVIGSDLERGLFVWTFDPLTVDVDATALRELDRAGETVSATIRTINGNTIAPGTVELVVDGGSGPTAIPMTAGSTPGSYTADLPSFGCGAEVTWYVSARTPAGVQSTYPASAPALPFVSFVGDTVTTARYDSMQTDNGWEGDLPGDTASRGQWTRERPNGTSAEPNGGYPGNGRQCWFTGQAAIANNTDADVDQGFTTLLSPVLDLSDMDYPVLEYYRWFSNVYGQNDPDDAFEISISNDAGATWQELETIGPLGPGTEGGWIRSSFLVPEVLPPTDQIQLRFVASDTGRINIVEAAIDEFRVYDLGCDGPVGTAYCQGAPNSTGLVGEIVGEGTAFLAQNDLELVATNLPLQQTGFFVVADGQASVPLIGGGQGTLCVGGTTGRYLAQAANSGSTGTIRLTVDATALPQPTGTVMALAGETWNFQCWHRDANPGPTSNFTEGYSVTFR